MGEDHITECDFDEIALNPVSVVAFVPDLMDQSKLRLAMPDICFVKEVSELIDIEVDLAVVDLSKSEVLEVLHKIDSKILGFASHVDKEIIALNAIAKLSELKDPRNALSTGLLHCNAKLTRELPIDK